MMKNNNGFSYIELLIVLGIMAVAIGFVSLVPGMIGRTNVNKAADKLVTALGKARTTSVAKGTYEGQMMITCDGNDINCFVGNLTATSKVFQNIARTPVQLYYVYDDGSSHLLENGYFVSIRFDQSSGAFAKNAVDAYVDKLILTDGEHTATIQLYKETGKFEIK